MDTLVEACCRTVARYFESVESVVGVPAHHGRRIMQLVMSWGMGDFSISSLGAFIRLFSEAYGAEFLSSLQLPIPSRVDYLPPLPVCIGGLQNCWSLCALSLDGCGLGLRHEEVLPMLGGGHFGALRFLSLRDNHLSNDQVRSLTAHARFHRRATLGEGGSGSHLCVVDLSRNAFLSEKAVKLVTATPSLQVVYLNDTGASVEPVVDLPKEWTCHRDATRARSRMPPPKGWFWEEVSCGGGAGLEASPQSQWNYESPFVICRKR